jgi:hypothetical protein
MKRLRLATVAVLAAALVYIPLAYAGGIYEQYPGGTAPTGVETFAADTNLSGGRNPQTGKYTFQQMGVGATQYSTPLTGATTTVAAATRQVLIEPAGTIAAHTLVLPAASALQDGQKLGFCTTQVVTALTVTAGSGTTVMNAPTAMLVPVATGAASCVTWQYYAATTKWYRIQ